MGLESDGTGAAGIAPGTVLGRYLLLEPLGEGGMGVVHRAYDPDLDRSVAIKLVHPGGENPDEARRRLVREARAMARLAHPNIVRVHDVGEHEGDVFIAVDLVEGTTLKAWLRARPRSLREILRVFVRAGRGLAAAHDAGLVHRDFKPDNVLVDRDGGVFVTDFGLARETAASHRSMDAQTSGATPRTEVEITRVGDVVGTPAYMAPEQLRSGFVVDARADQYAFCVTLWEAVYGVRPFRGETVEALLSAVMRQELAPVPAGARVPSWLRRLLLRGLARVPSDRHPSLDAALAELQAAPRRRSRRLALGITALVVATAGGVSAWRANRGPCRPDPDATRSVWDPGRDEHAFADTPAFTAAIDAHAAAWVDASARACAATRVHGEQSERVLAGRERCLAHALRRLGVLVEASDEVEPSVRTRAAWSLPRPDGCLREPAPSSESAAEALAEAEVELLLGRRAQAEVAIGEALAQAELEVDAVVQVEAWHARATLHLARGEREAGEAALHHAIQRAEAIAHDAAAARAWAALIAAMVATQTQHEDARRMAILAQAAAERAGDDRSRADIEVALAQTVDGEAAHEHLARAVALRERVHGSRHPEMAGLLQKDARALLAAHRPTEAVAAATRALAISQDVFDGEGAPVRDARAVLADALAAAGELDAAAAQREGGGAAAGRPR